MQPVIASGDHSRHRQTAIGSEIGHLALPGSCQHVADFTDGVLHDVVDRREFHSRHASRNLPRHKGIAAEDTGAAQDAAEPHDRRDRFPVKTTITRYTARLIAAWHAQHDFENLADAIVEVLRIGYQMQRVPQRQHHASPLTGRRATASAAGKFSDTVEHRPANQKFTMPLTAEGPGASPGPP